MEADALDQQRLDLDRQRDEAGRASRIREGIISSGYLKDTSDRQWTDDAGMKKFNEFLDKYYARRPTYRCQSWCTAIPSAQTMVQVLKQCGDNLTRENVMKQAASMKDFEADGLIPGIKVNTSRHRLCADLTAAMMRFKGEKWELFGDIISAESRQLINA